MFHHHTPLVTICIPLFETEQYLGRCLESVGKQDFQALEVIVVDDCSPAEKGRGGKEIVKAFKKTVKFPVTYIRHEKNKGLVEVRRTAVYEAKGEYILILDSDDTLAENAVKILYEKAVQTGADIVQGRAQTFFADTALRELDPERTEEYRNRILLKVNNVYAGEMCGPEIFNGYLVKNNHQGFLWGKLFRKETYLEALSHIPPVFCTMAEDLIQYFWISYFAKKYEGIQDVVYCYSINTGISSRTKIENLERWEKVCSTASVFTAIYSELERLSSEENLKVLNEEQRAHFNALCCSYVKNNLNQLSAAVVPEIQSEARKMLEDFWGEEMVKKVLNLSNPPENS